MILCISIRLAAPSPARAWGGEGGAKMRKSRRDRTVQGWRPWLRPIARNGALRTASEMESTSLSRRERPDETVDLGGRQLPGGAPEHPAEVPEVFDGGRKSHVPERAVARGQDRPVRFGDRVPGDAVSVLDRQLLDPWEDLSREWSYDSPERAARFLTLLVWREPGKLLLL